MLPDVVVATDIEASKASKADEVSTPSAMPATLVTRSKPSRLGRPSADWQAEHVDRFRALQKVQLTADEPAYNLHLESATSSRKWAW